MIFPKKRRRRYPRSMVRESILSGVSFALVEIEGNDTSSTNGNVRSAQPMQPVRSPSCGPS